MAMTSSRDQSAATNSHADDEAGPSGQPDCRHNHTDNSALLRSSRRGLHLPVLLCGILLLLQSPFSAAVTPLTDWKAGIATNYGGPYDGKNPYDPSWGTLEGSCGYGKLDKSQWPYWSVAALASSNSFVTAGPLNACGQCFEVKCVDTAPFQGRCITGSNQVSVIVQITDICPECTSDHIDIQALTYNKLSSMETGRISIMYRRVECVPPKPMVIYVDNNGGQGNWLRLFVEQAGGDAAVKQVQVRTSGSQDAYSNLNNKWGSDWETSNAPKFPLDINIIGADGESVSAYQVIQNAGATGKMPTSVQFKISNPGDQALTAAINSDGSSTGVGARGDSLPPAVAPGASPGASPSPGGGSSGGCTDIPPSSTYTCQQQKDFNACGQSWMSAGKFCQQTCGQCSGGSSSGGSPGSSGSPSWSPTPSGSPSWSPSSQSGSPSWTPSPSWSSSSSPSWSPSPNWSSSNSPNWSPSNSNWSPSNSNWSPSSSPNWSPSWSPSNSPSWSPPYSPSSNSPYASGGRKLLAPAQEAGSGTEGSDDNRLVITLVPRQ